MKHNLKYVISLVFMLMLTQSTWADPTVTIIKKVNGSPAAATTTSPGEVSQAIADGKCTLTVTPEQGYYVTKDFITVYSVVTGNAAQGRTRTPDLDKNPIEVSNKGENTDPTSETTYEFTMPGDGSDAEVTVDFHSITTYNLYIGETQVTELNAADVLGNGTVEFTVSKTEAPVYTLTLNGAELTVPVKVGLDNLTIDIKGENSITTTETCLQKMDNTNLSLTFKSTSNPVGSLTLTTNGQESEVSEIGEGEITISKELAPILPHSGNPGGYSSNMYWFTDDLKEARFVPSYGVKVGDVYVFAGNETDVLYDKTETKDPSVSFDKNSNTLTLNNASDISNISTSLSTLNINLVGSNSLFRSSNGSIFESSSDEAITINLKSTGTTKGSLKMETQSNSGAQLKGDNVTLTAESPLVLLSGDLTTNKGTLVYGVNYDLWISDTRVTSANASNIWDGTDFEFDAENSILYYRDGGTTAYPILSGLPNLTIKIGSPDAEGNYDKNNIGVIKFGSPEGVNIAATSGTLTISKILDDTETVQQFQIVGSGQESNIIQGFTTVDYSDFVPMADGITYNTETKKLVDASGNDWGETTIFVTSNGIELSAPTMSGETVSGVCTLTLTSTDANSTIKYSVDYVDSTEEDVTDATYDSSNKPTISKPATVTAYVTVNGFNSTTTKGKYFDSNPSPFKLVYGADPIDLVLAPAIEVSDGISISGIEANVTYNSGKISSSTIGSFGGHVAMSATAGKTVILNNNFTMNFEVVPPVPTITSTATLEGDEITIESAVEGAAIYYSWSADDDTGTLYTTTAPTAKTGTLYAWAKVTTENGTVTSDKATKEFTVKKNLANAYVEGLAESGTYTGNPIIPTFTLKESDDANAATISSDNYDIVYEKYLGETQGYGVVESIVDVGIYKVSVKAKGDTFGGEKYLNEGFAVNQAENSLTTTPAAVAGLTYTGEAKDLITAGVATFGDVQYKLGANGTYSTTIPTATDANTTGYTVYYKVEGTDNYAGIAEASIVVAIAKANVTITQAPTANTLTYTGSAQALAEAGTVSEGTMVYSKTINGTFTEAIPEETNAGTYTVYYKVDGNDNYNGIDASETNKVSVTINPATITGVTLQLEEPLVYSGEPQTVEIATVTAGTLVLTNDDTEFAKVFDISGNSATEKGTYTVTVAAKENSNFTGSATADFSIKYRTASLDLFKFEAGQTFGTFYSPEENLELPETIKAYIISGVSGNSVTLTELNYIPMGVPVLVEKIEGTATRPEANPETTDNMLKYASENASLNRSAGTLYVLYNGMFVRATNNTVAVQNVYLQVPVSTPNSARTLSIKGGDGTTAIESVNRIESSDTDRWYDMQGRRIERPTKTGIYLNNGKKVVIK